MAIEKSCPKLNNFTDLVIKKIVDAKENFLDFYGQDDNPLVFKTTLQEIKKYKYGVSYTPLTCLQSPKKFSPAEEWAKLLEFLFQFRNGLVLVLR